MDDSKVITVAAMGRTGTHLLVEIIKTQFRNVVHIHHFTEKVLRDSDVIISSKRDFREQMASTKRFLTKVQGDPYTSIIEPDGTWKGRRRTLLQECEMAMEIYNDWLPYTVDIIPLELWFTDPKKYILRVYETLNVPDSDYDDAKIGAIIQKLQAPIHPNHITKTPQLKNYDITFNEEEIQTVIGFFDENHKEIKNDFIYLENYL